MRGPMPYSPVRLVRDTVTRAAIWAMNFQPGAQGADIGEVAAGDVQPDAGHIIGGRAAPASRKTMSKMISVIPDCGEAALRCEEQSHSGRGSSPRPPTSAHHWQTQRPDTGAEGGQCSPRARKKVAGRRATYPLRRTSQRWPSAREDRCSRFHSCCRSRRLPCVSLLTLVASPRPLVAPFGTLVAPGHSHGSLRHNFAGAMATR